MKAQVREIAVLASAMLLGACTSTSAPIPTSVVTTTTTTMTTTTTTVPTTTVPTTTMTTVVEVDGVPADLLALIGAPMPEVDLTIESEEDVERWLEEWIRWRIWLEANPVVGLGEVDVGAVSGGDFYDDKLSGLKKQIDAGKAFLAHPETVSDLTVDFSAANVGSIVLRFNADSGGAFVVYLDTLEISSVIPGLVDPVAGEVVLLGELGGEFKVLSWLWKP